MPPDFSSLETARLCLKAILYFDEDDWETMIVGLNGKTESPFAALEMLKTITDVSEYTESATWSMGCEYTIWRRLLKDKDVVFSSAADITNDHKRALVRLQKLSGGWWQWDDDMAHLPTFMTTAEWRSHVLSR